MFSFRVLWVGILVFFLPVYASSGLAAPKRSPAAGKAPAGPVVIELEHGLSEEQAERLLPLIDAFNTRQKDVEVRVFRRVEGRLPKHLNLATREEHARFVMRRAQFRPVDDFLREARVAFNVRSLSPDIKDGLVNARGQLLALPLAYSTPVLYFNKTAFRKAGLDPESPPKTWRQVQEVSGKLYQSGAPCPFTTSWPVWVMIDNMSVWNGARLTDPRGRLAFDGLVQIKHIAMMTNWRKAGYFHPFGAAEEADRRFAIGECAMLTSASSIYSWLRNGRAFEVGISTLPYHDDVYGAPKNTLSDGASLWIAKNLKPAERRALGQFLRYILAPEVQIGMTVEGGFLPMTPVARAAASSRLLKEDLAALRIAERQLIGRGPAPRVRASQIESVRLIVDKELEDVWANVKPAKEALETAVERGNAVLYAKTPRSARKAVKK
ncbi:MAG: extracellular solute-binding protein [Candidatus Accumulibacter sp.]|jgi:sn-glycerol 3-phosphate transport system substrate-binding protein|nr:extracellular solute-binding protein [Accumulibacter sp.]